MGTIEMAAKMTAIQVIPLRTISLQAVPAIKPPIVRLALQRLRSPLVLKTSVKSRLVSVCRSLFFTLVHIYVE